jgi:hypothetical protein
VECGGSTPPLTARLDAPPHRQPSTRIRDAGIKKSWNSKAHRLGKLISVRVRRFSHKRHAQIPPARFLSS